MSSTVKDLSLQYNRRVILFCKKTNSFSLNLDDGEMFKIKSIFIYIVSIRVKIISMYFTETQSPTPNKQQ